METASQGQAKRKVLLIGNGPNRAVWGQQGCTWESLMAELMGACQPYSGLVEEVDADMPFSLQMAVLGQVEETCRELGVDSAAKAKQRWLHKLARLEPTRVYNLLGPVFKMVDAIYTTNYDHVLERFSKKTPVTHIHGDIKEPTGMILFPADYGRELEKAKKRAPRWMEDFCQSELHICGLSLRPEEHLLWYALRRRLEIVMKATRHEIDLPRVFFYNFYEDSDAGRSAMRRDAELCRVHRMLHEPIFVPQGNYFLGWENLVGRLLGNILQLPHDNMLSLRLLSHDSCNKRHVGRGRNVSVLQTPDAQFPQFVRLPIKEMLSKERELREKDGEAILDWYFLCDVPHEAPRYFVCPIAELRRRLSTSAECLMHWGNGDIYFREEAQERFTFKKPLKCNAVSENDFQQGIRIVFKQKHLPVKTQKVMPIAHGL